MPPLHEQRDLECPNCDGILFIAVTAIRTSGGGGTIYPPRGHQCLSCQHVVNVADLLNKEELRQMEEELRQKQAQIQARRPPVSSTASSAYSKK